MAAALFFAHPLLDYFIKKNYSTLRLGDEVAWAELLGSGCGLIKDGSLFSCLLMTFIQTCQGRAIRRRKGKDARRCAWLKKGPRRPSRQEKGAVSA